MKKKILCFGLCFVLVSNITITNYQQVEAAQALPYGIYVLMELLFSTAIVCGVIGDTQAKIDNLENLTDEEKQQLYEEEQAYLNDMKTYMVDGSFGSTQNCYVIASDGSTLTLEDALETATSMEQDDYFSMRKETKMPDSSGGKNWKSIFIDVLKGGLMDFLACFLNDKTELADDFTNENYMVYTGDDGYINRSTGELDVKVYADNYYDASESLEKRRFRYHVSDVVDSDIKSQFRMCVVLDGSLTALSSGYRGSWHVACTSFDGTNIPNTVTAGTMRLPGAFDFFAWYIETNTAYNSYNWNGYVDSGSSSRSFNGYYFCNASDVTSFEYFSTNLPIFSSSAEAVDYLNGLSCNPINYDRPYTAINSLCDSYKGKVVTADGEVVEPTPTPIPSPTVSPTPTLSPTPTPSPYPTWDKELGNGDNFTTYNFYTEVSNMLNPIKVSVENIYNFFQIDTDKVKAEISFETPEFASKFAPIISTLKRLENEVSAQETEEENQEEETDSSVSVEEQTGINASGASLFDYPKITFKCPQILDKYLKEGDKFISTDDDGNKVIVLCDFADYAVYFVRFRGFLAAALWFGMIFYFMREIKVDIVIS